LSASLVKTEAIVLRVTEYSETSQVVWLCARGHGRVHLLAKGARRARKDGSGPFGLLDRCYAVCWRPRSSTLWVASEWSILSACRRMRRDLMAWREGMFACELALAFTHEADEDDGSFELLDRFLRHLDVNGVSTEARFMFEMGMLRQAGLAPHVGGCAHCGKPLGRRPRFSAAAGGALCDVCAMTDAGSTAVSRGALAAMSAMMGGPRVQLSPSQRGEIDRALTDHIEYHLGRPLRTARSLSV